MSLVDITWSEIVTALLALYAAILSTAIAIRDWRAKTPRIGVAVQLGNLRLHRSGCSEKLVFVSAANDGEKAVPSLRIRSIGGESGIDGGKDEKFQPREPRSHTIS